MGVASRYVAGAIPFVLLGSALLYRAFVTDDAYIFATYARHFAEDGQLAFNRGEPIHAISSPLWQLVAIALQRVATELGDPDAGVAALRVASGVCMGAAAGAFIALTRRVCRSELAAALAAAFLLLDPWLWRWASAGMEAGLAMLLVVASLWLLASPEPRERIGAAALLAGLGVLTRPELGLLAGLAFLAAFAYEPHRPPLASRGAGLPSSAAHGRSRCPRRTRCLGLRRCLATS